MSDSFKRTSLATAAVLAVVLFPFGAPAGTVPVYTIEGTVHGTENGDSSVSPFFCELTVDPNHTAQLHMISLAPAAGTWKTTGEFTESFDFTDGIETAFETASGKPAKVNFFKLTKVVELEGFVGGQVKADFRWVPTKSVEKVKIKFKGSFGGDAGP